MTSNILSHAVNRFVISESFSIDYRIELHSYGYENRGQRNQAN